MKRSRQVAASVVASLVGSGLLTACGNDSPKPLSANNYRCVDDRDFIIDESLCDSGFGHYYYGGFGGSNVGDHVDRGEKTKLKKPNTSSSVKRGGIGSSAKPSSGGTSKSSGG